MIYNETTRVEDEYMFTDGYSDNILFWEKGIATVILVVELEESGQYGLIDLGAIILEIIDMNNY